jgi:hypothetical protein
MKKVIAILTIMAVFSTAVFAAPLSVAGSLGTTSSEITLAGQTSVGPNGLDELFADVNATALTDEEAAAVEGDGPFSALIGAIVVGAMTVAAATVDLVNGDTDKVMTHLGAGVGIAAVAVPILANPILP